MRACPYPHTVFAASLSAQAPSAVRKLVETSCS
jgi:hypothetical protein